MDATLRLPLLAHGSTYGHLGRGKLGVAEAACKREREMEREREKERKREREREREKERKRERYIERARARRADLPEADPGRGVGGRGSVFEHHCDLLATRQSQITERERELRATNTPSQR